MMRGAATSERSLRADSHEHGRAVAQRANRFGEGRGCAVARARE